MIKLISRNFLFTLLSASVLFTACSKNDNGGNPGPNPGPGSKKLVKVQEDAQNNISFEYNTDGTIKKATSLSDGSQTIMTLTYNANKKVTEVSNDNGTKIQYIYAGSQLDKAEVFNDEDIKVAYNQFTYANGKLQANVLNAATEDENGNTVYQPWMKTEYSYYANGDVQEVKYYVADWQSGELVLSETRRFEQYDAKVNPLSQFGEFGMLFIGVSSGRNPTLEKAFDETGALSETIATQYTYDAQGYPTSSKETTTPAGGTATEKTMTFIYQ